jgi:hypothetical protein
MTSAPSHGTIKRMAGQRSDALVATIGFQFHEQRILIERVTWDTLRNVTVNLSPDRRDPAQLATREARVSDNTDKMARHCWSMARRVGMQIAELPVDMREKAFFGAERCIRAAGCDLGVAGSQLDSLVDLQMWAIRQIVTDIDVIERRRRDQSADARPPVLQDGP